jgi:hypothetical protein
MTEPRRVFVGLLPTMGEFFVDGVDPVATMLREANAKLDAERDMQAEQARRRAEALAANVTRTKATRRARLARRFSKALAALGARAGR